jgi:hypothetical protein
MVRYDDVGSLSKKISNFVFNMDTPTILFSLAIISVIALVIGFINESIITAQNVVIIIITVITIYIYFKKEYSIKIKKLKLKNRLLKKNSVLDELCGNKKTRKTELCNRYHTAKSNFYTISNMLLQKYNIIE